MKPTRILSALLAAALTVSLLSLCGCKGDGNKNNGNTGNKQVNVEDVYGSSGLSEELIEVLQNSGEIMLYTDSAATAKGERNEDEQGIDNWFRDYYGLTIRYKYQAYGDDLTKFMVDFAAHDAPDAITLDYRRWPKAGNRQIVYDLDEIKALGVAGLDHPTFLRYSDLSNRFAIGNKVYGLSVSGCLPVVVGVNLDLFEQYKVKSPVDYYNDGTWDMDAYVKCAKELTRTLADGTKIWGAFGWNYNWFLVANDARLVVWDSNYKLKLTMNDPKTIRSLTTIQDLYAKEYTPKDQIFTQDNLWASGKIGVYLANTLNMAKSVKEVTFRWEIVPMPYGPDNTSGEVPGEMDSWGMVTSTKNPQGVINYLIASSALADKNNGKENGLYYFGEYDGAYSDEQLAMIYSYCDKTGQDLVMGVGTLGKSFKFWNDLRDGGMTVKECIDTYENFYQEQVDAENQAAKR